MSPDTAEATSHATSASAPPTAAQSPSAASPALDQLHAGVAPALRRRPFFIVGCQRSGTTWISRLLDAHPQLRCHGEAYFGHLMPLLRQVQQVYNQHHKAGELGNMPDGDIWQLLRTAIGLSMTRWLEALEPAEAARVQAIGEKTPEHAQCMPALLQAFPNARFIHVIRDGRDVCVSGWYHNKRQDNANAGRFEQQFPRMNAYIRYTVESHWVPYIQKAQAFGQAHPDHYLELHYESLHADPTTEVARLLRFLDVDADDASVAQCVDAGSFETLSGGRARGEADAQSFYRKGVVGDWREHFDESNVATFEQFGGALRQALGYEA